MIVRWPGRTTPGSVCGIPSDIADIYPTVMEMAGVNYDDFKRDDTTDGESLLPLLADRENETSGYRRDEFYHFYGKLGYTGFHHFATWATLRKGDYKLHYDYHGKVELYNVAEDISEAHDLTRQRPELARSMLAQLTDWLRTNCNPAPTRNSIPWARCPTGRMCRWKNLRSNSLLPGKALSNARSEDYQPGQMNYCARPPHKGGAVRWWRGLGPSAPDCRPVL
jgi:hypothetical protein